METNEIKKDPFLSKMKEWHNERKEKEEKWNKIPKKEKERIIKNKKIKEREEKLNIVFGIIGYIFTFPFTIIYRVFFRFPRNKEQKLLGFFRVVSMFFLVCLIRKTSDNIFGISYGNELENFFLQFFSKGFTEFIIVFLINTPLIFNFIAQLFVLGGFVEGKMIPSRDNIPFEEKYENIIEALDFREGVLNMKSSRGKMEELAKTAFITKYNFQKLADSPNTREGIEFLEGQLNMQSTRGKYNMLKNMFGGK